MIQSEKESNLALGPRTGNKEERKGIIAAIKLYLPLRPVSSASIYASSAIYRIHIYIHTSKIEKKVIAAAYIN